MNEWKGERGVHTSKRVEGERKERAKEKRCYEHKDEEAGLVCSPGFPVGVNWGKEQQKVGL